MWVRSDGENLEQDIIRAEIETWEYTSLGFQVVLKLSLAEVETVLEGWKLTLKEVITALLDHVSVVIGSFHDLEPESINLLELLGLSWHLLGDITSSKDCDQVTPKSLDLKPFFNGISSF